MYVGAGIYIYDKVIYFVSRFKGLKLTERNEDSFSKSIYYLHRRFRDSSIELENPFVEELSEVVIIINTL